MSGYPSVTITVNYAGGAIEITEKADSYTAPLGEGRVAAALLARAIRRAVGAFGPEVAEAAEAVRKVAMALDAEGTAVAAASEPVIERPPYPKLPIHALPCGHGSGWADVAGECTHPTCCRKREASDGA